jgi:hypothetical protein
MMFEKWRDRHQTLKPTVPSWWVWCQMQWGNRWEARESQTHTECPKTVLVWDNACNSYRTLEAYFWSKSFPRKTEGRNVCAGVCWVKAAMAAGLQGQWTDPQLFKCPHDGKGPGHCTRIWSSLWKGKKLGPGGLCQLETMPEEGLSCEPSAATLPTQARRAWVLHAGIWAPE